MALRGTLTHRKTRRLARLLSVSLCHALGILEALWHLTAEQYPDGDISALTPEDIAEELYYEGDPEALIAALVDSKWIERTPDGTAHKPECTMLVRGWSEHADSHINAQLAKRIMLFADGTIPKLSHDSFNDRSRNRIRAAFAKKYPHLVTPDDETPPEGPDEPTDPAPNGPGPVPDPSRTGPAKVPDRSRTGPEKSGPYQEPGTRNQIQERGEITSGYSTGRNFAAEEPPPPPPPRLTVVTGRDLASGGVFKPPTVEECVEEGRRWGLPEGESRKFWAHYAGTDWRIRGDLIVNWRARMEGWRQRHLEREAERKGPDSGGSDVVTVTGIRAVVD